MSSSVIFDLGNTLVGGSSGDAVWYKVLLQMGYPTPLKLVKNAIERAEITLLKGGIVPEKYKGRVTEFWVLYDIEILKTLNIKGDLKSLANRVQEVWSDYNEIVTYDDTLPILRKLKSAGYKLAILSNAFENEITDLFKRIDIDKTFFDIIAGFDTYNSKKPSPECYQGVLNELGATSKNTVMVGDQVDTDGVGAHSLGIRFVHIVRNKRIKTPEWAERITSLNELPGLLVKNKKNEKGI